MCVYGLFNFVKLCYTRFLILLKKNVCYVVVFVYIFLKMFFKMCKLCFNVRSQSFKSLNFKKKRFLCLKQRFCSLLCSNVFTLFSHVLQCVELFSRWLCFFWYWCLNAFIVFTSCSQCVYSFLCVWCCIMFVYVFRYFYYGLIWISQSLYCFEIVFSIFICV